MRRSLPIKYRDNKYGAMNTSATTPESMPTQLVSIRFSERFNRTVSSPGNALSHPITNPHGVFCQATTSSRSKCADCG